ncbi:MAG: cation:proton antiporter, partial [Actinomycetes bacterium]
LDSVALPIAIVVALLAAWVTELIGIHAVFGAFVAGAVLPGDRSTRARLEDQLQTTTTSVLLPVFFVVVGASVRIDRLGSLYLWGVAALVIAVATAGKLVGAAVGASLAGESRRDSLTLGLLMNTRGLTEIVILTVGLELGVIDTTMFSIGVVMAIATTVMAAPLLRLVRRGEVAATLPPG